MFPELQESAADVIVVVIETKVAPEQAARALETARDGLRRAVQHRSGRRQSRFFQGREDPASFLYLGTWESRDEYDAIFGARQTTDVEQSLSAPAVPRYFRILLTYERVLAPTEIVVCQIITGPASGAPPLREYIRTLFDRRDEAGPGLVVTTVCEEIDAPGNMLLMSGWQSPDALARGTAAWHDEFVAQVAAAGATFRRFVGHTRYDSLQSV